jgi:signal transduction histidine kinase
MGEEGMELIDDTYHGEAEIDASVHGVDVSWVTSALMAHREDILTRWLTAALALDCHRGRRDRAVADHIPALFDAIVASLDRRASERKSALLDDSAIQAAAQGHALVRADQGLHAPDILAEFRILRQEIGRALRLAVPDGAPTGDVVAAEMLLNDALDGANALALAALTTRLEGAREEILATTIHDVRQPLASIKGYTQLAERILNRPEPDAERIRDALQRIRHAADQMMELLETLVDVSRTALGAIVLDVQPTDLRHVLEEALEGCGPDVASRVHLDLPGEEMLVGLWDPARLEQVFSNVLSNAAKYAPGDTPITLTMEVDAERVVVQLHDEGIGIPPDDLPRLFGRYTRASNAVEREIEGTGLGLYLSKGIVEAHGGHIWAISPGHDMGTTVFVELPLEPEPNSRPATKPTLLT